MKKVAATFIAAGMLALNACGSDAPIPVQPNPAPGQCFEGHEGGPCGGEGGTTSDGGGGDTNTGGDTNIGGGDSGGFGGDSGSGGTGDTGGDAGSGGDSGCSSAGEAMCGGTCTDLNVDYNNCGVCGKKCSSMTTCQSGSCLPCPVGKWNCYTTCADIKTDNANCGGCGIICDSGKTCTAGFCK